MSFGSSSESVIVRPATQDDLPAITQIQQRTPDAAQWPVNKDDDSPVLVALILGTLAGFCAWRQTATDEAELLNLAVDPAFRRRGVGSALLAALREAAHGTIFLEVAENNAPAIALYRRAGWEPVAVRKGYYYAGNVDAVVMKKSSC